MNLIFFADPTILHPIGDPVGPVRRERPAVGGVDELLSGGLGVVNRLFHILPADSPLLHESLDFLGDIQTHLFTRGYLPL